ncbi:MAG: hypothetical protein WCD70_14165 [Alphaproteobacteria bacterium]
MKRLLIFLMLAACAPSPPVFKPVPVEIPVAEACTARPVAKPDFALSHIAASDNLFIKAKAALTEIDQRRAYEAALESQLSICP